MSKQTRLKDHLKDWNNRADLELFVVFSVLGILFAAKYGAGFEAFGFMALWTLGSLLLTVAMRIAFDGVGTTLNNHEIAHQLSDIQQRLIRMGVIALLAGGVAALILRAG
jgi:phosphoribosylaminoimidazole (AIR) synthetase